MASRFKSPKSSLLWHGLREPHCYNSMSEKYLRGSRFHSPTATSLRLRPRLGYGSVCTPDSFRSADARDTLEWSRLCRVAQGLRFWTAFKAPQLLSVSRHVTFISPHLQLPPKWNDSR